MSLLDHTFFSDVCGAEYEIMLSAWGEGILSEDALLDFQRPDAILKAFKKRYKREPESISLRIDDPRKTGCDYCYTGVDPAFLERFEALKELILPESIGKLEITPELARILRANDTLIRGEFGSFAESFAAENRLHFRPADLVIAEYDFHGIETTVLTLKFGRNGEVYIKEDVSGPGSSGGNTFGGSFAHELKKDFYKKQTAEEIATKFRPALAEAILSDGRLAAFIETAKTKGYFSGKN